MGTSAISAALTDLYDEVLEFTDECAFFCDAYAALAIQNDGFDTNTASGISLCAQGLKPKAVAIQQRMKAVQESCEAMGRPCPV